MNLFKRFRVPVVLAIAMIAGGCRDAGTVVQSVGQPSPKSVSPGTSVAVNGPDAVVTLVLDVRGDVGKIGSFTGRLRYDPSAMTYAGEIGIDDGTMRVSNPGPGEIRVAGASASGINPGGLASFRFAVTDRGALSRLAFDVEELHELSRADLQSFVRSATPRRLQ